MDENSSVFLAVVMMMMIENRLIANGVVCCCYRVKSVDAVCDDRALDDEDDETLVDFVRAWG